MPRRTVQKCSRRYGGERLDATAEFCLTQGHAFGVRDWEEPLQSQTAFRRLWDRWGDEIADRWIEAFPGSRPLGLYLVGKIELPAWQSEYPALRHPVVIGGEIVIEDRSWHCGEIELDHLDALGLVSASERRLAVDRLSRQDASYFGRYRCLADDA